jgi:hypothetical protein
MKFLEIGAFETTEMTHRWWSWEDYSKAFR